MYLTGKLENVKKNNIKKKKDPVTWLFLAFDFFPLQMFPKQQEYNLAVSLYYVTAIFCFLSL